MFFGDFFFWVRDTRNALLGGLLLCFVPPPTADCKRNETITLIAAAISTHNTCSPLKNADAIFVVLFTCQKDHRLQCSRRSARFLFVQSKVFFPIELRSVPNISLEIAHIAWRGTIQSQSPTCYAK